MGRKDFWSKLLRFLRSILLKLDLRIVLIIRLRWYSHTQVHGVLRLGVTYASEFGRRYKEVGCLHRNIAFLGDEVDASCAVANILFTRKSASFARRGDSASLQKCVPRANAHKKENPSDRLNEESLCQ